MCSQLPMPGPIPAAGCGNPFSCVPARSGWSPNPRWHSTPWACSRCVFLHVSGIGADLSRLWLLVPLGSATGNGVFHPGVVGAIGMGLSSWMLPICLGGHPIYAVCVGYAVACIGCAVGAASSFRLASLLPLLAHSAPPFSSPAPALGACPSGSLRASVLALVGAGRCCRAMSWLILLAPAAYVILCTIA